LGQRWYFSFDEGLDDQGQIALANWIIANRDGWDYTIYPDRLGGAIRMNDLNFLDSNFITGPLYTGHTRETATGGSNGKDGPVNMERRLASYREAHAVLDREIAGEKRALQTLRYAKSQVLLSPSVEVSTIVWVVPSG